MANETQKFLSYEGLGTYNSKVKAYIVDKADAAKTSAIKADAVVVTTDVTTEGYAKSYTFTQNGATIATVDIPKDMVVSSGKVVVNPEGQDEGTYLELTLSNATSDKVYINVGKLVDIYTAKANATQVQIAIDSATREVSATIVAGGVGSTELADGAVITAKIGDAQVTKARLATFVFSVEISLVFVFTAPSASSFTFVSATPAASKAVVSAYAADFKPATKTSVPSTATVPSVLPVATD